MHAQLAPMYSNGWNIASHKVFRKTNMKGIKSVRRIVCCVNILQKYPVNVCAETRAPYQKCARLFANI